MFFTEVLMIDVDCGNTTLVDVGGACYAIRIHQIIPGAD